jgi:hypothetical protein
VAVAVLVRVDRVRVVRVAVVMLLGLLLVKLVMLIQGEAVAVQTLLL